MQRILVVEDDPLVSETILCVLEEHYQVTLASSVCGAASCLREEPFDIVLLDCILPGGKVADLIAQAERHGASVVLTSGDPEQIEALGGGRLPFLAKPFSLNRLLDLLAATSTQRAASLASPGPDALPQIPAQCGALATSGPSVASFPIPARRSRPGLLAGTAWTVVLHAAAATLLTLTPAPAAAAAVPHPD
ncbi:MAG TPA: response regulator [Acetobacteraceae bacterium]|nr:response regulator [Acetobacteraceae bacterium]